MRPLFLEFKGLNSFSEKTQIDFEPLLKGGIFGIFGETGSGKSTILDAINFALFGDIGRSAVKTDKINDKCDSLEAKLTFDIFSSGSRKKYYVERSIKRKSGTHSAMLYELADEGGKCIADNVKSVGTAIVDVIGINEEDFKKCIALPQGEFSKFVKSVPSERTELIERLFSLQKYGENLKFKLSRRKAEKEGEYNTLNGKLSFYSDVTADKLDEFKREAGILSESEVGLKKKAEEFAAIFAEKKTLLDSLKQYLSAKDNFNKLKAEKPFYDEMGSSLGILPYCSSALDCVKEINVLVNKLEEKRKELKNYSLQSVECEKRRIRLSEEIEKSDYSREYDGLIELYGKMSSLLPDADNLEKMRKELDVCRKSYRNMLNEIKDVDKSLAELNNNLNAAQEKLKAIPEIDLAEYFGSKLKSGILKDEYAKNLCYIKDLQDGVNFYADGSALYEYITKELNLKAEQLKQLILSVKDARLDVDSQLEFLNENIKKRRAAENLVNKYKSELQLLLQKRENMQITADQKRLEGERLKAEYDMLLRKLSAVFGQSTDYRNEAARIKKNAEAVKLREKADKDSLKKIEDLIQQYAVSIASAGQACKSAEERITVAEKQLEESLAKSGLKSAEECSEKLKKYGDYNSALDKYNKYNALYVAAESEVLRLNSCADKDITEEIVKSAETDKINAENEYSETCKKRAVIENDIKNMRGRLAQKKELEKDLKALNAECDLIAQLEKLIRDNKFMKFIANEHLVNISDTASKTLIDLTDGRYFLKYEENNFCVGDNFNGGSLRRVNTLSGGETFLVSLSLALALSDTICRRSLKSTEFFFLDEGFGTLDGDLIETVLDALEKLKSADFTIGLISHVEELKHRINNKILVSKATESHGSTVRVSC